MQVLVEIEETTLEGDTGNDVEGVRAICTRCQHEVESFGTSGGSVRRCLAVMREKCPQNERNFYVVPDDDADAEME